MTPFGPVPRDYPNMKQLCAQGHIALRTETVRVQKILPKDAPIEEKQKLRAAGESETVTNETWYIVQDAKLVPTTYKNTTGKSKKNEKFLVRAANDHLQFQMILDFVTWKAMEAFRAFPKDRPKKMELLDCALGMIEGIKLPDGQTLVLRKDVHNFQLKSWRDLNNLVANAGVPGYTAKGNVLSGVAATADALAGSIKDPEYGAEEMPF